MLEVFNEILMLWVSIVMMVLIVAAFTRSNVFYVEWELRANWKSRMSIDFKFHKKTKLHLFPLFVKSYHPKIPSRMDHKDQDEEDPIVVFMPI